MTHLFEPVTKVPAPCYYLQEESGARYQLVLYEAYHGRRSPTLFDSLLQPPAARTELTVLVFVVHTRCLGKHSTSDYAVALSSSLLSNEKVSLLPHRPGARSRFSLW